MTILSTTETVPKLISIVLILREGEEGYHHKFTFETFCFQVLKES